MVDGGIGTKGPSGGLKGECLSPKALPTQLGLHRQDGRPSAKFTSMWMVKTRPMQYCLRGYPGLLSWNRASDIENLGLPGTLYDLRIPHGLHDQGFPGH